MKTNKILVALALPALFAACTAEEIVNQADNNALENRALLGDLVVNMETPVASRASWSAEDLAWGAWEEDDAFSGALVDAAPGTVGNSLLTNYVYKKNAEGEWTTTSQMVEGIYSFYSYKGITTKNDRKPVEFDLTTQVADLDNATKVIDDHQLFFSALYNVEAKNTTAENNIALPLTFYPYHSIAAYKMVNTTGQTLLISQIIAEGEFAAKGAILPTAIKAAKLNYNVRKNEAEYKLQPKTTNADGSAKTEYTAKEIKSFWQESDLDNADDSKAKAITLSCGNYEWEAGQEVIAYMVMPANAEISGVKINVVDEEGEAKFIQVTESREGSKKAGYTIASTGITKVEFKRSIPVSMFGYTSAGAPKAISVKAENLKDAEGYYIDNKEALEELINVSRGNIKVYNFGEFAIDAEVAELIAEYTGGVVTFTNPINIKDTEEVVVKNIVFDAVTVKGKDAKTGFKGTTVVFEDATTATLTIEAGATVTIEDGTYANIVNNGTLSVLKDAAGYAITTNGTLNVYSDNNTITLKKGALNYLPTDKNENGTIQEGEGFVASFPTIAATDAYSIVYGEDVTLEMSARTELTPATNKTASVTVKHNFNASKALVINKGVSVSLEGDVESTNWIQVYGSLTTEGETDAKVSVELDATWNNNGEAVNTSNVNNGKIVTGEDSKTVVSSGTGSIDNTNEANVTANAAQEVFYILNNATVEDLEAIKFKRYAVNTLRVTGTLTMDRPFGKEVDAEQLTVLNKMILANNAEVKVDGEVHVYFNEVVLEGNAKISGWSKAESSLKFDRDAVIKMTNKKVTKASVAAETAKPYALTLADVSIFQSTDANAKLSVVSTINEEIASTETATHTNIAGVIVLKDANHEFTTSLEGAN